MRFPKELKYTKSHEWARVEGKTVTVGITDHAQHALGDIVYLELPHVGRVLKQGETFGVVESIKAVSDLYSPAAGKVTEVHSTLISDPSTLNKDPYESGWLIRLELSDPSSLNSLMDANAYTEYVAALK